MGGVKKFDYPKYVWSPTGGWWCNPRNWRRSTAIAFVALFAVSVPIAYKGLELERRPVAPYRHIPSQKLAKHAKGIFFHQADKQYREQGFVLPVVDYPKLGLEKSLNLNLWHLYEPRFPYDNDEWDSNIQYSYTVATDDDDPSVPDTYRILKWK